MICRIEPTVPSVVVGDALRLRQVLGNLLSNAVKYTEHGEVEIRVGLDDMRDGQCRLHFSVRDTGPRHPGRPSTAACSRPSRSSTTARASAAPASGCRSPRASCKLMGGERIDLAQRGGPRQHLLVRAAVRGARGGAGPEPRERRVQRPARAGGRRQLHELHAARGDARELVGRGHACSIARKLVADRMQNAALRGTPFDVVLLDHSLPDAHHRGAAAHDPARPGHRAAPTSCC